MISNTSSYNTGIGHNSLCALTTGSHNTAIGNCSGGLITGTCNVLIGTAQRTCGTADSCSIVIGGGAVGCGGCTTRIGTRSALYAHT